MRTLLVVSVLIFIFTMMVLGSLAVSIIHQSETPTVEKEKEDSYHNSAEDLAWCESIGHQNIDGAEKYRPMAIDSKPEVWPYPTTD